MLRTAGAHQVGEVKVYNTIISDAAQLLRGATQAFGATRARLLQENLGDFAPKEVVAPRSDGAPRTAKPASGLPEVHPRCSLPAPRSGTPAASAPQVGWQGKRCGQPAAYVYKHQASVRSLSVLNWAPRAVRAART